MNQEIAVATYFTSLKLVNFRRFGDVELNMFDDQGNIAQWTLLLGDNGVGKTTLLQALAWMRPVPDEEESSEESSEEEGDNEDFEVEAEPERPDVAEVPRDEAELEPIRDGLVACSLPVEKNLTIEGLFRLGATDRFQLVAELAQGSILGKPPASPNNPGSKTIRTDITFRFNGGILVDETKVKNPDEKHQNVERDLGEFWEPFVLSYGAHRWTSSQFAEGEVLEDPLANNLSPNGTELHDAQEELIALQAAVNEQHLEWLIKPRVPTTPISAGELEEAVKTEEKRLLNNFKKVVVKLLPFVASDDDIEVSTQRIVRGETQDARVSLRIDGVPVPFDQLSLGYQSTLAWALDLAWRMSKQYSSFENPLAQPATVLIDEVDLHLHPRWQWIIMARLSELFPRTQFIASSHSPLMVQSMPKANFAIMHEVDGEIEIENSPEFVRGWRVDQILNSEYFGFDHAWDRETEALFDERDQLLNAENRSEVEQSRLLELERLIEDLPVADTREDESAMRIIREAAEILKRTPPRS